MKYIQFPPMSISHIFPTNQPSLDAMVLVSSAAGCCSKMQTPTPPTRRGRLPWTSPKRRCIYHPPPKKQKSVRFTHHIWPHPPWLEGRGPMASQIAQGPQRHRRFVEKTCQLPVRSVLLPAARGSSCVL